MEEWQKPETIALWIAIIIGFLLLLLAFIIVLVRAMFRKIMKTRIAEEQAKLAHQKSLLTTTIETQEKERKRIAADLHDALIGKLTVIKMKNEMAQQDSETVGMLDESITIARRISHDLSPPLLEYTALPDLISDVVDPWKEKVTVTDQYDVRTEDTHTNKFKIQLTRIIQEVLTNISKHAEATHIHIHFRSTDRGVCVLIVDNGKGFNAETNHKGLGLTNIETRVQYLGGKYRMRSKINEGTAALFVFKKTKTETP